MPRSDEELDRGAGRFGVKQVDPLQGQRQAAGLQGEVMEDGADEEDRLVALRLGVVERGPQHVALLARIASLERRQLQQVVGAAWRLLGMRARALQPLDAQAAQELVFV